MGTATAAALLHPRLAALSAASCTELLALTQAADEARGREVAAAVVLQRHCRGWLMRRRLDVLRDVTVEIQRHWRGYLGRQRAHAARELRDKNLRQAYFRTNATHIQRHWRGFWSRKHLFDFHARKLYLQQVALINAQVRAEVAEEGERAAVEQKALAEAAARKAFEAKVGQLHHLLSTSCQPGIFASPFAVATDSVPFIAGAPVEDHLKLAAKKSGHLLASLRAPRTQRTAATGPTASARPPQQQQRQQQAFLPPIDRSATGGGSPGAKSAAAAALVEGAPVHAALDAAAAAAAAEEEGPAATGAQLRSSGGGGFLQGRGKGGSGSLQPTPTFAYPAEVELRGLGMKVPRHTTLRQAVPYDFVRQAEQLERRVDHAEMLARHPLPFNPGCAKAFEPLMATQSNGNLTPYYVGQRKRFDRVQTSQAVSSSPFMHYSVKPSFVDGGLFHDVTATLPDTLSFRNPAPPPERPAGVSCAELRRKSDGKIFRG